MHALARRDWGETYIYADASVLLVADLPLQLTNRDLRFHGHGVFGYVDLRDTAAEDYAFHSVCHIGRLGCEGLWIWLVWRGMNVEVGDSTSPIIWRMR